MVANFEKHINFDFLTNEYLGIQKDANQQMENIKRIFGGDQPQDIILEGDYDYCYKTLLCEMKEFYVVLKKLLLYFKEPEKQATKDSNLDEGPKSI